MGGIGCCIENHPGDTPGQEFDSLWKAILELNMHSFVKNGKCLPLVSSRSACLVTNSELEIRIHF